MLRSENSSLVYEKSDALWVNPYISDQQQKTTKSTNIFRQQKYQNVCKVNDLQHQRPGGPGEPLASSSPLSIRACTDNSHNSERF